MTNPLDYTIQDPDAMRYALMANDSAGVLLAQSQFIQSLSS